MNDFYGKSNLVTDDNFASFFKSFELITVALNGNTRDHYTPNKANLPNNSAKFTE